MSVNYDIADLHPELHHQTARKQDGNERLWKMQDVDENTSPKKSRTALTWEANMSMQKFDERLMEQGSAQFADADVNEADMRTTTMRRQTSPAGHAVIEQMEAERQSFREENRVTQETADMEAELSSLVAQIKILKEQVMKAEAGEDVAEVNIELDRPTTSTTPLPTVTQHVAA